jgi:hypothetical protein
MVKQSKNNWNQLLFEFAKTKYREIIVFSVGTLIQIPMLFFNLSEGDSFRFSQTTIVVREYLNNGINVKMPFPIFGTNSFIPFEFPLFQIIASSIGSLLDLDALVATRFTALVFFQGTAILVYLLTKKWFSVDVALICVVLFQFLPFGVKFAHSPMIEFAATFFILLAVLSFDKVYLKTNIFVQILLMLLASVCLVFGFLIKVTTGIALLPLLLIPMFSILKSKNNTICKSLRLFNIAGSVIISALAVNLWNGFSDSVKRENPITAYLVSSSPQMREWSFGTLQDRLDPKTWISIYFQYLGPITSGLLALVILTFFSLKYFSLSKLTPLLLIVFIGPLVFVNLYRSHQYYVAALYPILVILLSLGACAIEREYSPHKPRLKYLIASLLIATSFSTKIGLNYTSDIFNHSDIPKLAYEIRDNVPREGYILYLGCDWNTEVPYYSQRKALMIPEWNIKPFAQDLNLIDYVAFCDFVMLDRKNQFKKYFSDTLNPKQISENVYSIKIE